MASTGVTGVVESGGLARSKCGGKKRDGSGGSCTRPAGWGTPSPGIGRCKLHGGKTPTHRIAAEKELARQAVATYGLPREVDPATALLEEVHRTAGHVAWLGERVAEMSEKALTWGQTEESDHSGGQNAGHGVTFKAVPPVLLNLYQGERAHLVAVTKAAISAGIDERRVKLAEQHGSQLASVIRLVVERLGLSDAQRELLPAAVSAAIGALGATGEGP